MLNLLGPALHRLPVGPLHTIDRYRRAPTDTQDRLLRRLLTDASQTEWGRRFGFAEIAQATDVSSEYRARVPLHDYEDMREDVQRIRGGARDVMWPGAFKHFAVSSGTASAGKIIPVSPEMLAHNRSFSLGVGFNYLLATRRADFLMGRHVTLPGRIEEDERYPGTLIGEVSGLQAEEAPFVFKHLYQAVPNELAFLPNWERKLKAIAARTVDMDVRLLVMAPTWALVFFDHLKAAFRERRNRSAESVGEIWPNLQVFISGGVALSSYRELLDETIKHPSLDYLETYGASEGFFSFQSSMDDTAMELHLDNGVYYEFVRMDELSDPQARRYTLADVETDVRYALYVTTCSGLWAYGVGDVVRFTQKDPHKIVVAGRTSEMIDKYGEAVFGEEARSALQHACETTGARVRDYHIAPRPAAPHRLPSHQWLVEFEQAPDNARRFIEALDSYLCDVNRHYQIRREARAFDVPDLVALPEGTFYNWLKETKGSISGQTKVPRMSEERKIADGVLASFSDG